MSVPHVVIMAGGTGGHIFPALAVAEVLKARGAEVSWLGSVGRMEADIVPKAGYPLDLIEVDGLRGKGLLGWLAAPLRLLRATWQALRAMRRRHPSAVLGMGGFVAGPGGIAARLLGCPLIIHEQNAVAGLTNRLLAPLAERVFEAFPNTFEDNERAEVCGNPVRREIHALDEPTRRFVGREQRLRLLVIGGSLGAAALNETVPRALAELEPQLRPQVVHQAGRRNIEETRSIYAQLGVEADLRPFIDDMAEVLGWADLVVCRAGALTVSELAAAGVAAVLVPYPHAVDDHQTSNARYLADAGAAVLVPQYELDPGRLAGLLRRYIEDARDGRSALLGMAQSARGMAMGAAAETVAEACIAAHHEVRGVDA